LPESQTFIIKEEESLIGTITLVPDSPCGLPMEAIYPEEIASLRRPGRKLAEVSLLALDLRLFGKKSFSLTDFQKLSTTFKLFKGLFDYSQQVLGITDIVISMHPKHQGLYQYLLFRTIGDIRAYSAACDKPAVAMHLDVLEALKNVPKNKGIGEYFLKAPTDPQYLKQQFIWEPSSFEKFLTQHRSLWTEMSQKARETFRMLYPELISKFDKDSCVP